MLKGIIFDFDGVIAESLQIKTDAFVDLYKPFGADIVNKVVDHHEANNGKSRFEKIEYYHNSFMNKKITKKEISDLADQFSKMVINEVINSSFVPGVHRYIQKCSKKYKLFISTGTPNNEIRKILEGKNIIQFFKGIFGSPDSKIHHINTILSEYDINTKELLFFGDSNSDIEAAKYYNINFVLRIHEKNKSFFDNYGGTKINNFLPRNIKYFHSKYNIDF